MDFEDKVNGLLHKLATHNVDSHRIKQVPNNALKTIITKI